MIPTHELLILVLGCAELAGLVAGAAPYDITRSTIDGGGTMHSIGGAFELSGTIGQPDAGVMTGPGFELTGGFWFSLGPGDCDEDGIISLVDSAAFVDCLTGPHSPVIAECVCFDLALQR